MTKVVEKSNVEVYITKNKKRLKQHYLNITYLESGENFEIEIFNPFQLSILAKIKLNGFFISNSGIVVRPGERIYLERFLDTNRKFKFETYSVDNSRIVQDSIKDNGKVEVDLYMEKVNTNWIYGSSITFYNSPYYDMTVTHPNPTYRYTDTIGTTVNSTASGIVENEITTGRIEKGKSSSQKFEDSFSQFEEYSFQRVLWNILPLANKPVTKEDLSKRYCTNCGSRVKKSSWKYCPICGEELEE